MQLLDLPAELVRLVLYELDPESFYTCLLTCKTFREHAMDDSVLMLDQLCKMPGRPRLDQLYLGEAPVLFQAFCKAATQHLRHGAARTTDLTTWETSPKVHRLRSMLMSWDQGTDKTFDPEDPSTYWSPSESKRNQLVFVEVDHLSTIRIFFVESDKHGHHRPHLRHTISTMDLALDPNTGDTGLDFTACNVEVVKITQYTPEEKVSETHDDKADLHIAVLYRQVSTTHSDAPMKLLFFRLGPYPGHTVLRTFQMTVDRSDRIIAMTIDGPQSHILLEMPGVHETPTDDDIYCSQLHLITYYSRNEIAETVEQDPYEGRTILEDNVSGECLSDMALHPNGRMQIFRSDCLSAKWFASITRPRLVVTTNLTEVNTTLPYFKNPFHRLQMGPIIAHYHEHGDFWDEQWSVRTPCRNTILQLAISREEIFGANYRVGAFLVKGMEHADHLHTRVHEIMDREFNQRYVAQLNDLPDLRNLPTIGLKVAVSPHSYRIAIASWKTVKVWALDPRAFLDIEYGVLRSNERSFVEEEDRDYMRYAGWNYYDQTVDDLVMLDAVELPSAGVVYGLQFRNEDELWGWTEQGLVKWAFDANGRGRRETAFLE